MNVDASQVRRALDHDELVPCFQPIVELHTGLLKGFEILARWDHPRRGLILPANFISLAEENGLAGSLMGNILRKALQSSSEFPESLTLAVNVSPTQLHDLSLIESIREASDRAQFPLQRLTIEITESALLGNLELAQKIARGLKAMGCRLALDDFGTGYSSLLHLQAMPFDELKVDQSFIQSMTNTRESRKIVAAIVGLGHSLGLTTVGEGIETEEQANMLLGLGCERGQGWLYGRPRTAAWIAEMVHASPREQTIRPTSQGAGWVVSSLEAHPAQRLAQLQAIYDGAPVGLCFLDRNLRYVSLNQRLADIDGVSITAHLGRTTKEMIPDLYPRIEPFLLRALKGEAIRDVEFRWQNPVRIDLASYQPAFDESGEVIGVSIAVSDITHLKLIEESLLDKENRIRQMMKIDPKIAWLREHDPVLEELHRARRIFDSVCNGISICDVSLPDLPLVYVNAEFERMTGYTAQEVCGRNCRFLQGSEIGQPGCETIREAIRDQVDARALLKNYRKDGTPFWNELYLSPIFDLSGTLTHFVGIQHDVTQQVESTQRLEFLAHHDVLTGLANRKFLMEQLQQAILRARRSGGGVAVLFFDLDNFKSVNDVFGHDTGDRLLVVVAHRLRSSTRAGETVARLGGDEFVVVLEENSGGSNFQEAMKRLVGTLGQPLTVFEQIFHPSVSVGMAVYPADGQTPDALMKFADMHMYKSKHEKRLASEPQSEDSDMENKR